MENVVNNLATRSEKIIEARYSLTARQNNILDMLFTEIEDDDQVNYVLSVDKYKRYYKTDTSNIYRDLRKAVKGLEKSGLRMDVEETGETIYFPWFSKITYKPREGKIAVRLDEELKKILCELRKYIKYDIEYTLNFSSAYSQRIYFYLKSFEDVGFRIDKIEDLQQKLECPKTYYNFSNFKKYVLDVAEKEINEASDLWFSYKTTKTGRKVTHISFKIVNRNKQNELAIDTVIDTNITVEDVKAALKIELTNLELQSILDSTTETIKEKKIDTNILDYILEKKVIVEEYIRNNPNKKISFMGAMISALKGDWKKKIQINENNKTSNFDNFKQRKYDGTDEDGSMNINEIEKGLLGY